MPPKAVPMVPQQAPVQDTLGINPEYMLPHQRDQYRRHLQTMNDLQGRKAKEPHDPQLDASIAEARNQLNQLAAAAAQNEEQYPNPELFAQFSNQYQQSLQQRRAELSNSVNSAGMNEKMRTIQYKSQQMTSRMKEIEGILTKPEISEEIKSELRSEHQQLHQHLETVKEIFRSNQGSARITAAAATTSSQPETPAGPSQPVTPSISQTQPLTPTIRNPPPTTQPSMQPTSSQPLLPPVTSMGQLPRPSVSTGVTPARPTLTGGYPIGNPLLGTTSPAGIPHAFHLTQDGDSRLLSKRKLQDLVKSIDPDERLEPDVEEVFPNPDLAYISY
jgi:Transcription initiation factor TFIID subunit A